MKITITLTKTFEPNCAQCLYMKEDRQQLDHFGTPCTEHSSYCDSTSLEDECPTVQEIIDELEPPEGFDYVSHVVED